jgi:hypothetical protein
MGKSSPTHEPTAATKSQVSTMVMAGIKQDVIADVLDIDPKTLRKYYRKELDTSKAKVVATVANKLYDQCINGNVSAMMFFLKTQGGWREKSETNIISSDGSMKPNVIEVRGVNAKGND